MERHIGVIQHTTGSEATRRAVTFADETQSIVEDLRAQLAGFDAEVLLVFCSRLLDLRALGPALDEAFSGTTVFGCTTAGEVTPQGFTANSVTAVAFSRDVFEVAAQSIDGLSEMTLTDGTRHVWELRERLENEPQFGMLLVDGLSVREEILVASLPGGLEQIPLLGGSAGDDTRFERTEILCNGEFRSDRAVLLLFRTKRRFEVFKTQHFVGTTERLVVTAAEATQRVVREINGLPAAEGYALAIGLQDIELTPLVFASHPVVMKIGGVYYVRSIQKVNDDGSLTLFCAIEEGSVLTVARNVDMVDDLTRTLEEVDERVGGIETVIAFDCILRRIEAQRDGLEERLAPLFERYGVIGFSTYGEQFQRMHVNQTFTGLAIGRDRGMDV